MDNSQRPSFRILIVGAGIAGLGASIALALKGHKVTVIERTAALQGIGGGMMLSPQVCKILDYYGVLEKVMATDCIRDKLVICRYADGSVIGGTNFAWQKEVFGYRTVTVMRAEFQQIIYEHALKLGVEIRLGCRIKDIDQSKPSLTLENGELLKADLIVGADGVRSQVRAAVLGENVNPRLENNAYLCTVDGDRMRSDPITAPLMGSIDSHKNTTAWLAPGRHCICSPARWGEFYRMIIMINQDDPRAPYIPPDATWNTKGDVQKLRDSFVDHELRFRRVLDLMKPEDCRLWRISTMPDLPTWVSPSGRVVLAGDAAHAMCPYLAQGLAMVVEDSATLAECLARAETVDQIPLVLRAHESIRKPRAEKVKAASEGSGVEKHYPDGEQQEKRDALMKAALNSEGLNINTKESHPANWLLGLDVRGHANVELDKIFNVPNSSSKIDIAHKVLVPTTDS